MTKNSVSAAPRRPQDIIDMSPASEPTTDNTFAQFGSVREAGIHPDEHIPSG